MKVLWAPWRMEYILGEDKAPGCIFCPEPGEDLAERLVLFSGSLTIACSGPIAMELQHLAPKIIERINVHFGQALVTRLRFAQDIAPPKPPPPRPSPKATEAARQAVQSLPEGRLRDALIGLGAHLLAKP